MRVRCGWQPEETRCPRLRHANLHANNLMVLSRNKDAACIEAAEFEQLQAMLHAGRACV